MFLLTMFAAFIGLFLRSIILRVAATQPWVNGPAIIQVGTGTAGALEHLGWSANGVRESKNGRFSDIHADYGGEEPVDRMFHAERGFVRADVAVYDEAVMAKVEARLAAAADTFTKGSPGNNAVGTLMVHEGKALRLLILAPYSVKAAYTGMPAANYLKTWPVDAIEIDKGTRHRIVRIVWECQPFFDKVNSTYTLYNSTATGAAAIV